MFCLLPLVATQSPCPCLYSPSQLPRALAATNLLRGTKTVHRYSLQSDNKYALSVEMIERQ